MKKNLLSLLLVSISCVSFAQLITPFTIRYSVTQKGGITIIGNTATSCGAAVSSCHGHNCAYAHAELPWAGVGVDNDFVQSYVNIDAANTFMSSSDSLALPSCSLISYAGLYWGAGGAVGEADGTNWPTRANAKIKVNNGAYVNITADATFDNNTGYKSYHNFKNITNLVTAAGINARFTMANMPLLDDNGGTTNRWGGWAIVVVYRNDLQSLKNLIVFNGLTNVSSTNTITDIPISGFLTPPTGPVNFQLGLITYDGDRGADPLRCSANYVGDSLLFRSAGGFVPISDAKNPANDVMNSTITNNGVSTPYRNPLYGNTLGYDADIFVPNNSTKNYIANNATTATIRERTGGETYITQVVTSAIDVFEPDLRGGLRVVDLNGGTVQAGDTLEYTATIKNIGSNPSINTYIVDTFPFNCTYVPASMNIIYGPNSGVKTDALGDDQGDFFAAAKSIKVRIGTGANAVSGGQLLHSPTGIDSTQVKFRVTASTDCIVLLCNSVIANRFHVVGTGFISGNSFDTGSNPTIFDANGCPVQGTTNTPITSIACLPPSATNNSPVCIGGNVNLMVQTSPNATYSWTGPNGFTSTAQNPVITNATAAMAGVYTVVISVTGTNCVFTTSTTSVVINPTPSMTSASSATICSGGTVNIPLTSSIASSFTWIAANNPNTTGESITTQNTSTLTNTIVNNTTVPQTVVYTVTPTANTGGCSGNPQTVTVTVNPTPAITSPASATICSGATVNIPLTASVPSTFTWIATNNPNTTGESTSLQNTSTINNTIVNNSGVVQTVTYTVTPTATSGGCGSTATQIVTVTVNPVSTVTSSSSATICSGGTVNIPLTSTQGGTFTWIANDNTNTTGESLTTQNTSTINNTIINTSTIPQTVTYTVIPTAAVGGCVGASQTVSVLVNPTPVINSQNAATICSGGTVSIALTSNIASTYTWIASDNTNTTGESLTLQNTSTLSNTIINNSGVPQTVTYTVTPTATNGACAGATQTITVTVNPFPVMTSATTATICSGTAVNIPLTSSVPSSFTWIAANNPNTTGESTTLQNTSTINNTITNNSTVPQTVTYTVTPTATLGGCVGTQQTVTVIVNPSPVITNANSATICSGSTVNIPLTSSVPSTFTWVAGDNPNTSGESTTVQNTNTINNTIFNPGTVAQTVTYTVTPTATQGGCASLVPQIVTVIVNPMDSAAFGYSSLTYCQTGTDPAPTITGFSGGTFTSAPGGLVINSSTGLVDLSASVLGSYTITYHTNGVCPNSFSVSFSITTAPSAVFSYSSSVFCHGGTNPAPIFNPPAFGETFSSTPGLIIDPTTGVIDLSASTPGNYVITNTIAAAGGCAIATATTTITINPEVTVNAGADASICSGTSYILSGTFGGGASSITWSTAGSGLFDNTSLPDATYTPSAADISAGSVTLTITTNDPSGPCPSLSDNMVITITPAVVISAGPNDSICERSNFTLNGSFSGGATSIAWTSSGTGFFTPNNTVTNATYHPSFADVSAGSVTLTITSDDPAGPCGPVSDNMILYIMPAAVVNAGINDTICSGTTYTLNGSFGGGASSVTWSTSGTGTFNNASLPNTVYTPSAADISAGVVILTITTNDPLGPCPALTDFMFLGINPAVVISAGPDDIICSSSTYTMQGSFSGGATSITWTTSGTGTFNDPTLATAVYTPSAADISAGGVTLTITSNDPYGPCPGLSDAMVLTINLAATVSAGANATICATSNYTLSGTMGGSATQLTWSTLGTGTFDNIHIGNATYTPSPADDAALSVTLIITSNDPPGICGVVTDTIVIAITPRDNAGFAYGSTFYCQSGVDPMPTITGLTGGTFSSTPAGLVINPSTGVLTLASSATGTYSVMYLTNGVCPDSLTASITIVPLFVAAFSYPSIVYCENGNPNPSPVFIPGAFGGVFTSSPVGLVLNSTTGQVDLIATTPGTYTVYNTIVASGGCAQAIDSTTFTLTPLDNASIAYPLPAYCVNGVNPLPTITGLTEGTFTSTLGGSLNSSTGEITLPVATGTYNVVYTTNGACPNADTVPVSIIPVPVADAGPFMGLGCSDTISLVGTGSSQGANYSYFWTTTGGNIVSGGNTSTAVINHAGVYTLLVTDILTGCSQTDTVTVVDVPPPAASFTTSPNPPTGHVPLVITFTNTSTNANTFLWVFGDGTTSTLQNPVHTFDTTGVYTVILYASHNGHCVDSAEIIVVTYPNYAIIVPNVFTPNGDLVNDVFTINTTGVASINCYIYDRWGLKLYEWHTVGGFWDGHNANGTNAADGTYFFIYDLKDADGGDHSDKGTFMLIRN